MNGEREVPRGIGELEAQGWKLEGVGMRVGSWGRARTVYGQCVGAGYGMCVWMGGWMHVYVCMCVSWVGI